MKMKRWWAACGFFQMTISLELLQNCLFFLNIRNRESAANSSNLPKTIHRPCYTLAHNQMRNNFTKKMDATRAYNPTK